MIKYKQNMKKNLYNKKKQAFKHVYAYILDVKNEAWEV